MHAVFVACLLGGAMATALFAILGFVGGVAGHAGHAHTGAHGGHATAHGHLTHGGDAHPSNGSHATAHHGQSIDSPGREPTTSGQPSHTVSDGKVLGRSQTAVANGTSGMGAALGWVFSWLSPLTIAAAALWFGAGGLLAESAVGPLALLIAVVAAVAGAALIRAALNTFVRASTPPLQMTAEGAIATVNATIRPDAAGEVVYTLEGLHRSLPARSDDGRTISRGTSVVILRSERGMAWVALLDPLDELQSDVGPSLCDTDPDREKRFDEGAGKVIDTSG